MVVEDRRNKNIQSPGLQAETKANPEIEYRKQKTANWHSYYGSTRFCSTMMSDGNTGMESSGGGISSSNDENHIPIISLDDPDQEKTVEALRTACKEVGFFYLQGHGIEHSFIESVMEQSQRLFALPVSAKKVMSDPTISRGYTGMEEETLNPADQKKGDTKEGFYIGRDIQPEDPKYNPAKLSGPNCWPTAETTPEMEDSDEFRRIMEAYFDQISHVGLRVVRLIALAIGLPEDFFDASFTEPMAALRLLHYAAEKSQPDEGIYACGAHSDYGMVTILLTDSNPGLQILTKQGQWMDAPPVKDCFIVNLGDMLERWTNGMFKSTKHRVLTAGDAERYSIPFFYEPNFDTRVECLAQCCSTDNTNPAKYPPTTSGQHLLDKYKQTHADFSPEDSTSS
jgi:isopenicillin N synthase-like dioxygenase